MSQARPFAKVGKPVVLTAGGRGTGTRGPPGHTEPEGRRVVGRPPSRHAAAGQADNHTSAGRSPLGRAPAQEPLLALAGTSGREALSTHLSVTTSPGRHSGIPSELTVVAGPSDVGRAWTMPRLVSGAWRFGSSQPRCFTTHDVSARL